MKLKDKMIIIPNQYDQFLNDPK